MLRAFLTFVAAWVGTTALVAAVAPDEPFWTAAVGGLGAGFLAATVVGMEEGLAEDLAKGVIFGFVGAALLWMDMPGWVGWPLVLGPWVGLVGNRRPADPA